MRTASLIAYGTQAGKGNRSDTIGALFLATLGPEGQLVKCGKVGTGFKRADLLEAESRMNLSGPFVVEVEFHGLSREGKIRFPVFKGFRDDLEVTSYDDVGIYQFAEVPVNT